MTKIKTRGFIFVGAQKIPRPAYTKSQMTEIMKKAMRDSQYMQRQMLSGAIW